MTRTGHRRSKSFALRDVYSITSSARSRIDWGTVRPSALAVLTFTAISNLVGACTGRSAGFSPLYGAFVVKHLFHTILYFLHTSFFVRLGIPFLRPDPHVLEAGARRGCQGRPSLWPGGTLSRFQAGLDSPEHGGTLVVVGMTRPRGARCRGTRNSRRNLVSGGSQ